jgi:hypothetical protein
MTTPTLEVMNEETKQEEENLKIKSSTKTENCNDESASVSTKQCIDRLIDDMETLSKY